MTEIEKMYENAGIKICKRKQGFTLKDCTDRDCQECGYCEMPPLTADKQIGLIKWLIQKNFYDERIIRSNYEKTHFYCSYLDWESEQFEKFEEALANVINSFWQDLTDQEKEEIRGILNE